MCIGGYLRLAAYISQVRQSPFTAKFDAEAAYLLVGCLGGLGRSFSNWAIERGAKNLVFLSRSGAANPEAQGFLNTLHSRGVNAEVVKGDVSCLEDVNAAVAGSNRPIKGVIQGALTLHVWDITVPIPFLLNRIDLLSGWSL